MQESGRLDDLRLLDAALAVPQTAKDSTDPASNDPEPPELGSLFSALQKKLSEGRAAQTQAGCDRAHEPHSRGFASGASDLDDNLITYAIDWNARRVYLKLRQAQHPNEGGP